MVTHVERCPDGKQKKEAIPNLVIRPKKKVTFKAAVDLFTSRRVTGNCITRCGPGRQSNASALRKSKVDTLN